MGTKKETREVLRGCGASLTAAPFSCVNPLPFGRSPAAADFTSFIGASLQVASSRTPISCWTAGSNAHHLVEYFGKVQLVAQDMAAGKFCNRPGKYYGYCNFLPVYLGNDKKAQDTRVRIT